MLKKKDWDVVKKEHVEIAIEKYFSEKIIAPMSRSTFLVYNGHKLPAKHIRGMAYEVATGIRVSKEDYSGGQPTIRFFEERGFEMLYTTKLKKKVSVLPVKKKLEEPISKSVKEKRKYTSKDYLQKVALEEIMNDYFQENAQKEKSFEWSSNFPDNDILVSIKDALVKYRGHTFVSKKQFLKFDYVYEKAKVIIEFDEKQHFTLPRSLTFDFYPSEYKFGFDIKKWKLTSKLTNAKDNSPVYRDEQRAYYDSIRDVMAVENGYKIIRLKYNDFDWINYGIVKDFEDIIKGFYPEVHEDLLRRLNFKCQTIENNQEKYKVARIVTYSRDELANVDNLKTYLCSLKNELKVRYLMMPGGFLTFKFKKYNNHISLKNDSYINIIDNLKKEAQNRVLEFLLNLNTDIFQFCEVLSIGVDGSNDYGDTVELVAFIYHNNVKLVFNWTGKSYPTEAEKKHLIRVKDLGTHILRYKDDTIAVLGCHDLNVYSPRAIGKYKDDSIVTDKSIINKEYRRRIERNDVNVVLQHPHTADTKTIWENAWNKLLSSNKSVNTYSSGICFYNNDKPVRGNLNDVLESTASNDVLDIHLK